MEIMEVIHGIVDIFNVAAKRIIPDFGLENANTISKRTQRYILKTYWLSQPLSVDV
jgi:hypothetical protein